MDIVVVKMENLLHGLHSSFEGNPGESTVLVDLQVEATDGLHSLTTALIGKSSPLLFFLRCFS